MRKQTSKKLEVDRQTLRTLDTGGLRQVAGGEKKDEQISGSRGRGTVVG